MFHYNTETHLQGCLMSQSKIAHKILTAMKTSDLQYYFSFLFHLIWNTLQNTKNCNLHPPCVFIILCACTETSLNERMVASFEDVKLDQITH